MSEVDDLSSFWDDFDDFLSDSPEVKAFPDTAEGQLAQRAHQILLRMREEAGDDTALRTSSEAVRSLSPDKLHHRICSIFDRSGHEGEESLDQATDLTALSCMEAMTSSFACKTDMDEAIIALMSKVLGPIQTNSACQEHDHDL